MQSIMILLSLVVVGLQVCILHSSTCVHIYCLVLPKHSIIWWKNPVKETRHSPQQYNDTQFTDKSALISWRNLLKQTFTLLMPTVSFSKTHLRHLCVSLHYIQLFMVLGYLIANKKVKVFQEKCQWGVSSNAHVLSCYHDNHLLLSASFCQFVT